MFVIAEGRAACADIARQNKEMPRFLNELKMVPHQSASTANV